MKLYAIYRMSTGIESLILIPTGNIIKTNSKAQVQKNSGKIISKLKKVKMESIVTRSSSIQF